MTNSERELAELRARYAAVEDKLKRVTAEMPRQERDELAAAQVRADSVAAMFGQKALPPVAGETGIQYRRRLLAPFQKHSQTFSRVRLDSLDASALGPVEDGILAEARTKANDPASYRPGELVAIKERDASGREITTYRGDNMAWMQHFMTGAQVGAFVRNPPPGR